MSDVRQMSWLNPLSVPLPPKKFVTKYSARGKPCRAISQELNKRIHQLRKLGLKQWEIARELGVSRPTVGKHLQGARKL
jgi:DNA-binding transcriptional regulator YiaG